MARSRNSDPDDRDENLHEVPSDADDLQNAFPKKPSPLPWALLAVVIIFSAAAGYLGYTKLMEQQSAIQGIAKTRDDAVAKQKRAEADLEGMKASKTNLETQIQDLETQVKGLKDQVAKAAPADSEDAALVAPAKGSAKGGKGAKATPVKAAASAKKKKSSRH